MTRVSLPALVNQLLHDGVSLAKAEVGLQKARALARVTQAKGGIILIAAAALVALLALIGFVVGVTIALATLVGPGFAGLIVLVVGLAVAGVLGLSGSRRLSARPASTTELVS